ncbi:hypothetical protein F4805DRAFT_369434 [Annulohypoxylon moriforme]|nr:hypothetical protein F4805DRAFT_369434 [Annulohypoxylon moriforme]
MDGLFGKPYEYEYVDRGYVVMQSFPQFSQLPPEIRITIWEAAVPRRAVSLLIDDHDELPVLPIPAIAHVCRESRRVFLKHYNIDPYVAIGWFRHETDVYIWKPLEELLFTIQWLFRQDNFFENLTTLTLCDPISSAWVEDLHSDPDWDAVNAYNSWRLSEDEDPTGMRFIFRFVLEGKSALRTLNIFNHTGRSRASFVLETSLLSSSIAALFGTDSVLVIDHTDMEEVERVAKVLKKDGFDDTRLCELELTRISRTLSATQRAAHWNALRFDYKLMFLWEVYLQDKVRGLPADAPDVAGWDAERMMLRLNWDEDDPVVRKCLDRMPEIKFVYVILTQD